MVCFATSAASMAFDIFANFSNFEVAANTLSKTPGRLEFLEVYKNPTLIIAVLRPKRQFTAVTIPSFFWVKFGSALSCPDNCSPPHCIADGI